MFEKLLKHPLRFPLSGYTQCAAIDHHVGGESGADGPSTFNSSLVVEMLEMAYVSYNASVTVLGYVAQRRLDDGP